MNTLEEKPYLRRVCLDHLRVSSFEEYPFSLSVVRNLSTIDFHPDVTFIIGENGVGKSTLIEAIAVTLGFNPEGGTKNFQFTTHDSHSTLHEAFLPIKSHKLPKDGFFLRAESFYNTASYIDRVGDSGFLDSYGGKSLHAQSHGESFWSLMNSRFRGNGIYILDEPESALSPARQLAMLSRMHHLIEKNSQFIIATHSPLLLAYPRAKIYEIRDGHLCECIYQDTEHYKLSLRFLTSPEKYLNMLLKDDHSYRAK